MHISKLIFIANELIEPTKHRGMHMPLTFITFGIVEAKMYKHFGNEGVFLLQHGKRWGNEVVYGAVFALSDWDFYIRLLDAYHGCSKSLIGNHSKDIHHRHSIEITPITFQSIDELERLKYRERSKIDTQIYLGNINHPKINQRLNKTVSYRITDGIHQGFTKLFREVQNE